MNSKLPAINKKNKIEESKNKNNLNIFLSELFFNIYIYIFKNKIKSISKYSNYYRKKRERIKKENFLF
jgi:hypothetical protein